MSRPAAERITGVQVAAREARALIERLVREGVEEREIVAGLTLAVARLPAARAIAAEPRIAEAVMSGVEIGRELGKLLKALR
mgnify:CR=1 FL=1